MPRHCVVFLSAKMCLMENIYVSGKFHGVISHSAVGPELSVNELMIYIK